MIPNIRSESGGLMPHVQILQRDKDSQKKAPKVMQEEMKQSSPSGTRSFSTSARRPADALANPQCLGMQEGTEDLDLPELPLPSNAHMKYRYDPVIKQVTNLLMREGKLSVAQRVGPSVPRLLARQLNATIANQSIANAQVTEHGNDSHASPNSVTARRQSRSASHHRRPSCVSSSPQPYPLSHPRD